MKEQEILTEALAKTDVLSSMRKTLQKYGIPSTEPMTVSFKFGGKEVETKKFPGMPTSVATEKSDKDLKTAVRDLFNEAEVQDGFMEKIGLSNLKDKETVTITFKPDQNLDKEVALTLNWCSPCPHDPSRDCFC
ncbi:MAG: hypothetical protein QNJ65_08365 [Xenococcaceae cyanobacterium MO_234.B1]|nr:hypothetical protein [Xenococcaceae cyanobacterium MO_234.B1]